MRYRGVCRYFLFSGALALKLTSLVVVAGVEPPAMGQQRPEAENPCDLGDASEFENTRAIVYDWNQGICWLANANLAGDSNIRAMLGISGINPNGSMDFSTAQKWVAALNALNGGRGYLGHNNWQLPVVPYKDATCADTGTQGASFGPECTGSALGNLYYMSLKETFPNSVAPQFAASLGPLHNLKLSYYWALQNNGGTSGTSNGGQEMFSFANGIQGGTTIKDSFYYVLPMVPGAVETAPSCSGSVGVTPYTSGSAAGKAVYDCATGYTWLADANLAASNSFGITGNTDITYASRTIPAPSIDGGAMLFATATQWIQGMKSSSYLGSSAWQMPASSQDFETFFKDLGLTAGDTRLMETGSTGSFQNLQPFFYWGCERDQSGNSQSPCTGYAPPDGANQLQWTFDFSYGFQSTSSLVQKYFVMVYFPAPGRTRECCR